MDLVKHKEETNHKCILKLSLAILLICSKALMDFTITGLDPDQELVCLLNDTLFSINLSFKAKYIDS